MNNKNSPLSRIKLLSVCVFIFSSILIFKLYLVQIVHSESLSDQADKQYYRLQPNIFNRGSIYFENKDGTLLPAAIQKTGFSISVNPSVISNYEYVYKELSRFIKLDEDLFLAKMKKGGTYQKITERINVESAEEIRKLNLKGVNIEQEKWRFYPAGQTAARVLGIVAYKDDELAGRYGIERYYEDVLKRDNSATFVNFFAEVFANVKESVSSEGSKSKREGDVVTTLEPVIQSFLEEKLELLNKKWNSGYSGGIIIDPLTGEIKAMGVYPSFDPNNFHDEESSAIFSNPMVENVYEMGSIVKPITMAAGIDAGAVTPDTVYLDTGTVTLNNKTFSNYDGVARGLVNMQDVLNNSLNTGVAFVVSQMGKEKFADYMFNFGLGSETGIDLPNEAMNLVDNLKSNRDLEYATASFGQGIALTPVTMVRALSVLANGGMLINPHVVQKVNYKTGLSKSVSYGKEERVIKKETSEEITRMLIKVVDEALLGGSVKMANYSIAAKTGTAQIAKDKERGYYEDKFLHTFFGYFPAFQPKFLVFLFTYDPKIVKYSSESMTPTFIDLTKFLINYEGIPPDR